MTKTFKMGDRVRWESQAAGISQMKTGEVVHVIPPGSTPDMKGVGGARGEESYVVKAAVESNTRMGRPRKRTYWPLVSKLELA